MAEALVEKANTEISPVSQNVSSISVRITNIVATFNIGRNVDLQRVALKLRNAEFNPRRFSAVIIRIQHPKATALLFKSGKFTVTGVKSETDAKKAARKFQRIVSRVGFNGSLHDFKVQNISGTCDCKFPIRLESFALKNSLFASYEPELFPGVIYRLMNPKIVAMIFVSGKVVITGAKYRNHIDTALEKLYPVLLDYKKKRI